MLIPRTQRQKTKRKNKDVKKKKSLKMHIINHYPKNMQNEILNAPLSMFLILTFKNYFYARAHITLNGLYHI